MANPSLKAQIEAAKSALASGLAAPSLVAPPPEKPTAPIIAGNDIATDAGQMPLMPTLVMPPSPFRLMTNQRMPQMLPPWMSALPGLKPNY